MEEPSSPPSSSAGPSIHPLTESHVPDFDDDEDFADFAQADFVVNETPVDDKTCDDHEAGGTTAQDDDEEDNFADFQNFSAIASDAPAAPSDTTPQPPATTSSESTIEQKVRRAFPGICDEGSSRLAADDEAIDSSVIPVSLVANLIWLRLRKMSAMNSLNKFKWTKSHTFQSFTDALSVDPLLVERDGIPIFAADLCLLQPMKSTTSDRKESKAEDRIPTPVPAVLPNPQSTPVTAPATDRTCTPTSTSAHVLVLDALMQQQQQQESHSPDPVVRGSSSSSKSQLLVSQLEQELLSDLHVPNPESKERKTTDGEKLLQRLLTTGSNNSSCLSAHPSLGMNNGFPDPGLKVNGTAAAVAHTESKVRVGMSAEASQILDELPLLSFLRSNLTS